MAKKKTTRKTATKAKPKAAKASSKAQGKAAAKPAKPASKGRAAPQASQHAPHAKGASGSRHAPKKVAPRKSASKTPELFAQALDMAQSGFLFDAISAFKALAGAKSDMADDAQCNIGLCYLRMHLYADALIAFNKVITDFPNASIAQVAGSSHEVGHTAAKARLGRVHAFLGMSDIASARAECDAMASDPDSHVVSADGSRKSFHDLALAAVKAAGG